MSDHDHNTTRYSILLNDVDSDETRRIRYSPAVLSRRWLFSLENVHSDNASQDAHTGDDLLLAPEESDITPLGPKNTCGKSLVLLTVGEKNGLDWYCSDYEERTEHEENSDWSIIVISPSSVRSPTRGSIWNTFWSLRTSTATLVRREVIRFVSLPTVFKALGKRDLWFIIFWMSCGWIPLALDWAIFLIRESGTSIPNTTGAYNTINSTGVNITSVPHVDPTYFEFDLIQGDNRDLIFTWTKLCSQIFVFIPLTSTISLYIFSNLGSFKFKNFAFKLTIIYLTNIVFAIPIALARLFYVNNLTLLILGTVLFYSAITLGWCLLVRFLSLEWRVNIYWLPALQLCQAAVYINSGMPVIVSEDFLDLVIVYVPLVIMMFEYLVKKVMENLFDEHRGNTPGVTLSMAYVIYPMEVARFVSFILLYIKYKARGDMLSDVVWNAIFCVIGEIYTHTPIWKWCNRQMELIIYGTVIDDRPEIHDYFCSLRSCLEYVAPTITIANILLTNACQFKIPMIHKNLNYVYDASGKLLKKGIWEALGVYYLIELLAEVLCWVIGKVISYERISAIADLKWTVILTMIIYVGMAVDVPFTTLGYLRLSPL